MSERKNKKVTHIYKDFFPPTVGGIEKYLSFLAECVSQHGFDVEVFTSSRRLRSFYETLNKVKIRRLSEIIRVFSNPILPTLPMEFFRAKTDIFHFHFPYPFADFSYLISRLHKNDKIVVTYHSDVVRQKSLMPIYLPFFVVFFSKVTKIIVTTKKYAETSVYLKPFLKKCVEIPLFVDTELYKFSEKSYEIKKQFGKKVVLFCGVPRYYKGLEYLIEAMESVDATLVIVGASLGEVKKFAKKMKKAEKKIRPVGWIDEASLPDYLSMCDVFVMPSTERSEAFGLSLLEAMACSKPCITTSLGTGTDVVNRDGMTGFVVKPKSAEELAEKINLLLSDDNLRYTMGTKSRQIVEKEYSKEVVLPKILNLYNSL